MLSIDLPIKNINRKEPHSQKEPCDTTYDKLFFSSIASIKIEEFLDIEYP
jgi:hypothetical protein